MPLRCLQVFRPAFDYKLIKVTPSFGAKVINFLKSQNSFFKNQMSLARIFIAVIFLVHEDFIDTKTILSILALYF